MPNEIDLAAKLGVSTVTLRFALAQFVGSDRRLRGAGAGGGNFVRLPPKWVVTHARHDQRWETQPGDALRVPLVTSHVADQRRQTPRRREKQPCRH